METWKGYNFQLSSTLLVSLAYLERLKRYLKRFVKEILERFCNFKAKQHESSRNNETDVDTHSDYHQYSSHNRFDVAVVGGVFEQIL